MHKLDRYLVPAPTCLGRFHHGTHHWDDLQPGQRQEIYHKLEQLQGRLCAYCEGSLDQLGHHVEHFRRRGPHPQFTFAWNNLFWSCDRADSCGRFKDSGAGPYDVNDLIDPSVDDPDHFLRFLQDGTISPRPDLCLTDRQRALETIRVLGLDADFGRLRQMRRQAAQTYQGLEPDILEAIMAFPPSDRRDYVREELAKTATDPFCTVIRHLFEGLD